MRVAFKLAAGFLGVLVIVSGVQGYLRFLDEAAALDRDIERDHKLLVRALVSTAAQLWDDEGEATARRFISRARPPGKHLAIRLAEPSPDDPRTSGDVRHRRASTRLGRRYLTDAPVSLADGRVVAVLQLSESLSGQREFLRSSVVRTFATAGLTALLYAVLAGALGAVLIGRPVQRLVQKTRAMESGDLEPSLDERGDDELAQLAKEMNHLCRRLDEANVRVLSETEARAAAEERAKAETLAKEVAVERLRHADRLATVGQLASSVAHELGTPLNVVSGRARMILRGRVGPDDVPRNLEIILQQTDKIAEEIRALLDYSRRESPGRSSVDLHAELPRWLALIEPLATRRGVELAFESEDAPVVVEVAASRLQQVVVNLVVNGIHAMPETGRLTLRLDEADGSAQIEVRDQGVGMSADTRAQLFEPFFTTKPAGEGTGLGLSVAREIVEECGGTIEVESALGEGSCFRVTLPLAPSAEATG
jgi:signal transduction histidine kinase